MKDNRGDLDLSKQIDILKKQMQETENELALVKGINKNSPEMRGLEHVIADHQKEIWKYKQKESEWEHTQNQLEGTKQVVLNLTEKLNELREDNKKLAKQVEDSLHRLREAGL